MIFPSRIFVTGIDTGMGKTLASAVLCEALQADYWKPVQAGDLHATDSMRVRSLVHNSVTIIHPEAYRLRLPASPYIAAQAEGKVLTDALLKIPITNNRLVIEGAGGLMVQLRKDFLLLDFIVQHQLPVVIVAKNYLGCINHCLLTVEVLRQRGCSILGFIFSGIEEPEMQHAILQYTQLPKLAQLPFSHHLDAAYVSTQAKQLIKLAE